MTNDVLNRSICDWIGILSYTHLHVNVCSERRDAEKRNSFSGSKKGIIYHKFFLSTIWLFGEIFRNSFFSCSFSSSLRFSLSLSWQLWPQGLKTARARLSASLLSDRVSEKSISFIEKTEYFMCFSTFWAILFANPIHLRQWTSSSSNGFHVNKQEHVYFFGEHDCDSF